MHKPEGDSYSLTATKKKRYLLYIGQWDIGQWDIPICKAESDGSYINIDKPNKNSKSIIKNHSWDIYQILLEWDICRYINFTLFLWKNCESFRPAERPGCAH